MGERRLRDPLSGHGCRGADPRERSGRSGRGIVNDREEDATLLDASTGVAPAVAGASPRTPGWASLVGTFGGIGRMRPGPGTWASAATVLLWAALAYSLPTSLRVPLCIALAAGVVLIGIPAATQVARGSGMKDPQFVVVDELAGQLVALIAVPLAWKSFLAGFILFRA